MRGTCRISKQELSCSSYLTKAVVAGPRIGCRTHPSDKSVWDLQEIGVQVEEP